MSRKLASLFGSIMRVRSASSSSSSATPSPIIGRFCSGAAGPDNGCDYKHWLIEVEKPEGTRDEIIDGYVKLVASVLGSEDEARKKIYSVSTKYYFAVGVLASLEVAYKWKGLTKVKNVVPDCYVNRATKDYGGEPFVDGKPVSYDLKHHDLYHRVQARIAARSSGTTGSSGTAGSSGMAGSSGAVGSSGTAVGGDDSDDEGGPQ